MLLELKLQTFEEDFGKPNSDERPSMHIRHLSGIEYQKDTFYCTEYKTTYKASATEEIFSSE